MFALIAGSLLSSSLRDFGSAFPQSKGKIMQITSPFISGRRISGTLKLRSSVLAAETTIRSQGPRTTVLPPDKWESIEASWAAMKKRTRGGCAPYAVDLPRLLVLPRDRQPTESPIDLQSDLVVPNN